MKPTHSSCEEKIGKTLNDYSYKYHQVDLDEGYIHYIDEGEGPVILMVHGNPTWSYLYRNVINKLKNNYRVIAIDHLGMGLSEKPVGADYSLVSQSRRLGEFVDKLQLDDVNLMVQDWGGPIGLLWATKNKNKIKSLIIQNTLAFPINLLEEEDKSKVIKQIGLLVLRFPVVGELLFCNTNFIIRSVMKSCMHKPSSKRKEVIDGYVYPYQDYNSKKACLRLVRELPMTPMHKNWQLLTELSESIKGWDVPSLIVWGMRDPIIGFDFAKKFQSLLPNVLKTVKLEEASHFLQEDCPEEIAEAITNFLPLVR